MRGSSGHVAPPTRRRGIAQPTHASPRTSLARIRARSGMVAIRAARSSSLRAGRGLITGSPRNRHIRSPSNSSARRRTAGGLVRAILARSPYISSAMIGSSVPGRPPRGELASIPDRYRVWTSHCALAKVRGVNGIAEAAKRRLHRRISVVPAPYHLPTNAEIRGAQATARTR